jgi:multidrug resistance efflux pump
MEKLPPIPIPMQQRWREFRMGAVPVLMFFLVAASVLLLWRQHVVPPHIVGQVEGTWASVTSPQTGALAGLAVDRFQRVTGGEPIAHILTTDPHVLAASLDVIRAEVELIQAQMQQTQQRMLVDYERLRLNWMLERIELATAQVRLQQAESEFERVSKMFKDRIVPEGIGFNGVTGYEVARRDRDSLVQHIALKETMISELEDSLAQINSPGTNSPLTAALAVQEQKLRLTEAQLAPVTLHAPMDGLVSFVHRRPGETVMAGEPILTLSYLHADRIVGYIRQPMNVEPRPGMEVVVRSRSGKRASAVSKVLEVGTQMEPITPALLPTAFFAREESGLPILVALPPELNLIPGETVELLIRPSRSLWPWAKAE